MPGDPAVDRMNAERIERSLSQSITEATVQAMRAGGEARARTPPETPSPNFPYPASSPPPHDGSGWTLWCPALPVT